MYIFINISIVRGIEEQKPVAAYPPMYPPQIHDLVSFWNSVVRNLRGIENVDRKSALESVILWESMKEKEKFDRRSQIY